MKIIIEQKDVGKELDLDLMISLKKVNTLHESMMESVGLKSIARWNKTEVTNPEAIEFINKNYPSPAAIKKERKKPGPKPKIKTPEKSKAGRPNKKLWPKWPKKEDPQPLPESSDINPLTGQPYVRRGFTIDTPVKVIPVENEDQFNKKLQSL